MRKIKTRNSEAFTLIELLLGLALFSVIGLIVYSTFAGGIRLSRAFDTENEVYREVRMTFDLISKELENMIPYDFSGSYPGAAALKGEADKISFLSSEGNVFKFIQYSLNKPTDGRIYQTLIGGTYSRNVSVTLVNQLNQKINYLIRDEKNFFDALKETPQSSSAFEIISTHIVENSLKFSYGYYESDKAPELSWRSDWNEKSLPRVIRIELDYMFDRSDKKDKPDTQVMHFSRDILMLNAKGILEPAAS